jgi:hypothetical protein
LEGEKSMVVGEAILESSDGLDGVTKRRIIRRVVVESSWLLVSFSLLMFASIVDDYLARYSLFFCSIIVFCVNSHYDKVNLICKAAEEVRRIHTENKAIKAYAETLINELIKKEVVSKEIFKDCGDAGKY